MVDDLSIAAEVRRDPQNFDKSPNNIFGEWGITADCDDCYNVKVNVFYGWESGWEWTRRLHNDGATVYPVLTPNNSWLFTTQSMWLPFNVFQ